MSHILQTGLLKNTNTPCVSIPPLFDKISVYSIHMYFLEFQVSFP